jgi:group I intron endonuclease
MDNCGIYLIINLSNAHRYIGSSCNVLARWQRHQENLKKGNHHSRYLQRAYNLYGPDNFKFIFLQHCKREERLELEQQWMAIFKPEYNMASYATGGSYPGVHTGIKRPDMVLRNKTHKTKGHTGCQHSPETRAKMVKAWEAKKARGWTLSPEARDKISVASKSRKHTPESKAKISAAMMGHSMTPERIEKSAAAQRGRKLSPERIQLSIDGMNAAREKRKAEADDKNNQCV